MIRILVSSCLLGQPVRYNGLAGHCDHSILSTWKNEGRVVGFCPEVAAGLATPRPAAEIVQGDGEKVLAGLSDVIDTNGNNVTKFFIDGADKALSLAQHKNVRLAVLKENSPSCGSSAIYDGSFSGAKLSGKGVTAELLEQKGIRVFNELQLEQADHYLHSLE